MPVIKNDTLMTDVKLGTIDVTSLFLGDKLVWTRNLCTLTIVPHPATGSTVTLTRSGYTQVGNSITVPYNTTVQVRVTHNSSDYLTYNSYIAVNSLNKVVDIYLTYAWSYTTTGSDATLTRYNGYATDVTFPLQITEEE